jgi:gliding motility-associated protein GldE
LDEPPGFNLLDLTDQGLMYIVCISGLLFASAWVSAVEAAFFSLNNDDVDRFKSGGSKKEKATVQLVSDPKLLLSILSTCKYILLSVAAVVTVLPGLTDDGIPTNNLLTSVVVNTILFALFGVILPKIYGTSRYLTLARANSTICIVLAYLLRPIVRPLLRTSLRIEKTIDARKEQVSEEQLVQALQLATVDNEPIEGEKEILKGIVNFGTLRVKQVMRPRSDISFTDASADFHQLLEFVRKSGYSRVPVCRGDLDKVEGFLYIKDLLPFLEEPASFGWQRLLRPGYFVAESKKVDLLLKDFQEKRVHMALVVNHHGHTTGLITLEDVIEEIIGDINDEFDEVGARFQKINDRTYVFDGKTSLYEFCKVLQIDPAIFHTVKGINESLNAVLLEVNEKLPAQGDEINIDPVTFVIESVHNKRIKKIKVLVHENQRH